MSGIRSGKFFWTIFREFVVALCLMGAKLQTSRGQEIALHHGRLVSPQRTENGKYKQHLLIRSLSNADSAERICADLQSGKHRRKRRLFLLEVLGVTLFDGAGFTVATALFVKFYQDRGTRTPIFPPCSAPCARHRIRLSVVDEPTYLSPRPGMNDATPPATVYWRRNCDPRCGAACQRAPG